MIPKQGGTLKSLKPLEDEYFYGKDANARRNSLIVIMTLNGGIGNESSFNRW